MREYTFESFAYFRLRRNETKVHFCEFTNRFPQCQVLETNCRVDVFWAIVSHHTVPQSPTSGHPVTVLTARKNTHHKTKDLDRRFDSQQALSPVQRMRNTTLNCRIAKYRNDQDFPLSAGFVCFGDRSITCQMCPCGSAIVTFSFDRENIYWTGGDFTI